eukprot:1393255-Amorphochlora_amoeboformis.AAC.1
MELHQSEKRDTKSSAVRISVRSDDRKDDSKIAANESQISLHQPHTSASNPKEAMKENKSKEKHTIERPALAYSYECKARVCSALKVRTLFYSRVAKKIQPAQPLVPGAHAFGYILVECVQPGHFYPQGSPLFAAKDEKNGEPEIAQVMDQAEKAWSDVVDRDTLRENRVNLKRLEIEIYRSIHKLNVKLGRVSFGKSFSLNAYPTSLSCCSAGDPADGRGVISPVLNMTSECWQQGVTSRHVTLWNSSRQFENVRDNTIEK